MRLTRPKNPILAAVLMAAAGLALAAGALAVVLVASNKFNSRGDYREVERTSGGRNCERDYRKGAKLMRVQVTGSVLCAYSPPWQGDSRRPDHDFVVDMKLLKSTPNRVRKAAYLAIVVRQGRGSRYELQVFPNGKRYRVVRNPEDGNFPDSGTSSAINRFGKRNTLRLRALDNRITAWVNGSRLTNVTDSDAEQVDGARVAFGVGSRRDATNGPVATFDNLRLRLPNPG